MRDKSFNLLAAHQVELAVNRLNSLSTLACTTATCIPKLLQNRFSPADVTEIVEADPAFAVKIFSVAYEQGIDVSAEKFSLRRILDRLPMQIVRDALLSVKVWGISDTENPETPVRKALTLHSIATACCAGEIAEDIFPDIEPMAAYSAGLLHDIGKFALQEVMPRSFDRILEAAKADKVCSCEVEKEHLGTDHTLLGKKLARKWRLPELFILAIWLHHSDTATISQNFSRAKTAQIIQAADSIARYSRLGDSGSYDAPSPPEKIARQLGVTTEQVELIIQKLPDIVREKSSALNLESPRSVIRYCQSAHTAAAHFAMQQTEQSLTNRQLQTATGSHNFITEFLLSINSDTSPVEIAENFAARWQKFYQTGIVCLFLTPSESAENTADSPLLGVLVESLGQSRPLVLNAPRDSGPIPKILQNRFAIIAAEDHLPWLFEQLDVRFNLSQTKLAPLVSNGKTLGLVIFELHWPTDEKLLEENLRTTASIAASVLDLTLGRSKYENLAEIFAQLVSAPQTRQAQGESPGKAAIKTADKQTFADTYINALAEITAGIAHELNNPLSIISGRAQLLANAETNKNKKQTLQQIEQNARDASEVIEELMSFAEPPPARPSQTDVRQMLEEAIQLTSQKVNSDELDIQIQQAENTQNMLVDSAQVVSAIANCLSNALDSYADGAGPVRINTQLTDDGFVKIQISDSGCGMDADTLQKAGQPFFSAMPAGRKRGMGLAYTVRTVQLNGGLLTIESEPGKGTTVTILLPQYKNL